MQLSWDELALLVVNSFCHLETVVFIGIVVVHIAGYPLWFLEGD